MYVGRPSDATLDALVDRTNARDVTYDHVGSTLEPRGGGRPRYREDHRDIGHGRADFERAVLGLRSWVCHRAIGAGVHPADAPIAVGTDVIVSLPVGPFTALAPDRVVAVVEEADRVAFAYGTLPGHPEKGEECYSVELRPDGVVRFTIGVDAVPGNVVMWLGGPVVLRMQRQALQGYLAGLAEFVAAG